jgi:hypothetical protein
VAAGWLFVDFHVAGLIPLIPLAAIVWWVLMVPAWSYLATPIYRACRLFKYEFAFLRRTAGAEPNSVSLHLGTLYDLLWRVKPRMRARERFNTAVRREVFCGRCK